VRDLPKGHLWPDALAMITREETNYEVQSPEANGEPREEFQPSFKGNVPSEYKRRQGQVKCQHQQAGSIPRHVDLGAWIDDATAVTTTITDVIIVLFQQLLHDEGRSLAFVMGHLTWSARKGATLCSCRVAPA